MSNAEPDHDDTGNEAGTADDRTDDRPDPRTDPARALDEMEERTLDDSLRPSGRVDERDDDGTGAAFDVDLDPDEQGRYDTGAEQTG